MKSFLTLCLFVLTFISTQGQLIYQGQMMDNSVYSQVLLKRLNIQKLL